MDHMFSSIRKKLILIYILLISVPLILINYISIENMTNTVLSEIEVTSLKTANIVSNIYSSNIDNPLIIKQSIREYIDEDAGRVLVINKEGIVTVDSANLIENSIVDNDETKQAFNNQEGIGYYYTDKYILQVAVPVVIRPNIQASDGDSIDIESNIAAVVIVSTNVDNAFVDISNFKENLIIISSLAAIIAVFVAIIISHNITRPIKELSKTARSIGEGNLGKTVKIKSKDEIGRLAEDINDMSTQLYEIDQGRTQFIGNVSHELKSPLASIKALIDSLLYGKDDLEIYKEYLMDIDSEVDRLTDLINSLLDLTRIEEQGLDTDTYNIVDIVKEAKKILSPLANKYNVNVLIDLEDQKIICDKKWVNVLLINLIDNAIKYRDIEKLENYVKVTGKITNDGYHLIVEDNGRGIAEEELDSIFDKFYRTDSSRSRDTGGAGIGLSIVNRVITQHGWNISIESAINEGTSFKIAIPNTSLNVSL